MLAAWPAVAFLYLPSNFPRTRTTLAKWIPRVLGIARIPIYSKTCKWGKIKNLGIFGNTWEWVKTPVVPKILKSLLTWEHWLILGKTTSVQSWMNSLRILIIVSLIADNNKDLLTLTSIYIQHLLRLNSLKKQLSTASTILTAWYSKCDFSNLNCPNMSTTSFSSQLCLIKGHGFLKKLYEFFYSLLTPQKRWNILFSSESERFFFFF